MWKLVCLCNAYAWNRIFIIKAAWSLVFIMRSKATWKWPILVEFRRMYTVSTKLVFLILTTCLLTFCWLCFVSQMMIEITWMIGVWVNCSRECATVVWIREQKPWNVWRARLVGESWGYCCGFLSFSIKLVSLKKSRKISNKSCCCCRCKDLKEDFYLAPYTCAEIGFLYMEEGDLVQAKEYLERARYERRCTECHKLGSCCSPCHK